MTISSGTNSDGRKAGPERAGSGNGGRQLVLVIGLALAAVAGIVGMLVAEAASWDRAGLVLATLPLGYGAWRCWSERRGRM